MPLTPEETKRRTSFIKLVDDLTIVPNARNTQGVAARPPMIIYAKAEIAKSEMVTLLGEDFAETKAKVDAL